MKLNLSSSVEGCELKSTSHLTPRNSIKPLPLEEAEERPGYLAIANVVHGFRKQVETNSLDLAIKLFQARGSVIEAGGSADRSLLEWLNTHTANDKLDLKNEFKAIKELIESQNIEIQYIYENGAWIPSDLSQLSIDDVNKLMNGLRDYNFTLVQTSSADNLTFQAYLQSIGQTYYLLNQLQTVMNEVMKTIIQAIR